MRKLLTKDLETRLQTLRADRNTHTFKLKDLDPDALIVFSIGHVLKGLERQSSLVDIAVTLGRRVQQRFQLNKSTVEACHIGWFVLVSFIETGLLSYKLVKQKTKKGRTSKYRSYALVVKDKEAILSLWEELAKTDEVDLFPTTLKPARWDSGLHDLGYSMIKKADPKTLKKLNKTDNEVLFSTLNKLGSTGWLVNKPVLEVYSFFFENTTELSPFKFHQEQDRIKKESLLIEAMSIKKLAENLQDDIFYHLYNTDFRGRIYNNTAFLNEQGSDNAKGLLLRAEPSKLGESGYFWLLVHIANCLGYDKEGLKDRVNIVEEKETELLSFAEDPTNNLEWCKADKPWALLAACFELFLIKQWVSAGNALEEFSTNLPVYIDGTNNGLQHLTALALDKDMAPFVNLAPSDKPGDIYAFIAEKVWDRLANKEAILPNSVVSQFNEVFNKLQVLQGAYDQAELRTEKKRLAFEKVQTYRNNNRALREKLFPVYWNKIKEARDRRKICKRGVMTIPYGASQYGMGQQIYQDTRSMSSYLRKQETLWAVQLGKLLHKTCYEELKGPAELLQFFETIADEYNDRDEYMKWVSPITLFPVIQNYRKPVTYRTKLRYGDNELHVCVENWDDATIHKEKQRQGSSPNIVHSLDAVHATLTVHRADFTVSIVHDSFGCLPSDMEHLFKLVRETFVELYELRPLEFILDQLDCKAKPPPKGTLDITQVLASDFAFS